MTEEPPLKPLIWVGSSRKDLRAFPEPVRSMRAFQPSDELVRQKTGAYRVKLIAGETMCGPPAFEIAKTLAGAVTF